MGTDRERVWLVGLLLIVAATVAVGLHFGDFNSERAGVVLATDDGSGSLPQSNVTIQRVAGDDARTAYEGRVRTDAARTVVWRTGATGDYRITADVAGTTCTRDATIRATGDGLDVGAPAPPDDDCPIDVGVAVVD
jgi:hypothetical protein